MATTTTNFGWDIPQSTDLVKDGATAIATLGQDIDTAFLDLKGGTTGQYLAKASATDLDYTWTTVQTTASVPMKSGNYYSANGPRSTTNTATVNRTYYLPIVITSTGTLDRIQLNTGTSFSGTAVVRLGMYNMDATTGLPSTVNFDAGTVSCTAASTNYSITISQAVTPGVYYLAANMQTAATTSQFWGVTRVYSPALPLIGNTTSDGPVQNYTQSSVTGAFATAGTLGTAAEGAQNIAAIVRFA
jgi:hypothetical protein